MTDNELSPTGEDPSDLLSKLSGWGSDMDAHQSSWRDEARECFDLVAGQQWDREAEEALDAQLKPHVTFNRVAPVIDAVSGAEITGRQAVTYIPRQVGSSAVNEVLTKGAEWVRDRCDAEHEESDAARDTFICGLGVTETRMDYEEDPNGSIRIDRIDPIELGWDPSSRKTNLADARFIRRKKPFSREEFAELFPDADPDGSSDSDGLKRPTVVDPAVRYTNGGPDEQDDDTVWVSEWQWFEREPFYRVQHPDTGEVQEVHPGKYEPVATQAKAAGVELGGVRQVRRVYYRAFVAADEILHVEKIGAGEFTYKFMTGKRDRNKGVWYGLVRPMKDPQKFANKFFSQILHILNSNAKGGLMMEEGAVSDQRQFEESWAQADAITWLKSGALSNPAGPGFAPKKPPEYPAGQERMMEAAITAIRDSTGVNQEILGLADRDQPGVLEAHRKQAAYGILSAFFDGFKRYRKIQGRLMLRMMQLYLPASTLVRIVGDDGTAQYAPLALKDDTIEFDVIVDDAPAGPNQKEAAFQMLLQLMPILQNANLPPEIWAEFVRYSPLPNALSEKLIQALMAMQQHSGQPSPEDQAKLAEMSAKAANLNASAEHHSAQAKLLLADTAQKVQSDPQGDQDTKNQLDQAQLTLDRAKTGALMAKTVSDIVRDHRPEPGRTP